MRKRGGGGGGMNTLAPRIGESNPITWSELGSITVSLSDLSALPHRSSYRFTLFFLTDYGFCLDRLVEMCLFETWKSWAFLGSS